MRLWSPLFVLSAAGLVRAADKNNEVQNTTFNGVEVPPVVQLTPDTYDKTVNDTKFVLVKHYSPYCPHCADFAPFFQKTYEFYYTSHPVGEGNEDKSFSEFYDFVFAEVNCVAYYDLCASHEVQAYPSTRLYYKGEPGALMRGVKNITTISVAIEKALEEDQPGTRPKDLHLPAVEDVVPPSSLIHKNIVGEAAAPKEDAKGTVKGDAKEDSNEEAPVKAATTAPATQDITTSATNAATINIPAAQASATAGSKPGENRSIDDQLFVPETLRAAKTKSGRTLNENGISVALDAESFRTQVSETHDPWLIKFYAPWCHHCQAMAPNWKHMAREMKGRINVGEVNCDRESQLCKEARIQGYPSIHFFFGGQRVEYDGLRGVGDLLHYAEKAIEVTAGVPDVDIASFETLEAKEDVIFVYFYDFATTSEDFEMLSRFPMTLLGRARLVKTQDPAMYKRFKISTWPRLVVSREGRPTYYPPLSPHDMRDVPAILKWMKSVWLPIVPELTAANAREIMDKKIVVLGILNREDQDKFLAALREMKRVANEWMDKQIRLFQLERQELRDAKQLRIEEAVDRGDDRAERAAKNIRINMDRSDRKEVTFAWVDAIFWQRWIKTTFGIDVLDGDRVIINDHDNRRFWDTTITGNNIIPSRTSIMETITKVMSSPSKIKAKTTVSSFERIFFDVRLMFHEHPYVSFAVVAAMLLGTATWYRGRIRRANGIGSLNNGAPSATGTKSSGLAMLRMEVKELKETFWGSSRGSDGKVD